MKERIKKVLAVTMLAALTLGNVVAANAATSTTGDMIKASGDHSVTVTSGKNTILVPYGTDENCVVYKAPATGFYKIEINDIIGDHTKHGIVEVNIHELTKDNEHSKLKSTCSVTNSYDDCKFYLDVQNSELYKTGVLVPASDSSISYLKGAGTLVKVRLQKDHRYCISTGAIEYDDSEVTGFNSGYTYKLKIAEPVYISMKSVTLGVNESTKIDLVNAKKNKIQWSIKGDSIKLGEDGIITAVSTGNSILTAKYKGVEYSCRVFVK